MSLIYRELQLLPCFHRLFNIPTTSSVFRHPFLSHLLLPTDLRSPSTTPCLKHSLCKYWTHIRSIFDMTLAHNDLCLLMSRLKLQHLQTLTLFLPYWWLKNREHLSLPCRCYRSLGFTIGQECLVLLTFVDQAQVCLSVLIFGISFELVHPVTTGLILVLQGVYHHIGHFDRLTLLCDLYWFD